MNHVWLKCSTAVKFFGISRDTICRRAVPYEASRPPGKIRFKVLQLEAGGELLPRYSYADLLAFTLNPNMAARVEFIPVLLPKANTFHQETETDPTESVSPIFRINAAAAYLDLSRDSIEDRLIDWENTHVPYRIRCSRSEMKVGRNLVRRCYRPDIEALLKVPETRIRSIKTEAFHWA